MHFNRTLLLLKLALAASPLAGQITETYTFTTNRLVPDGNASGLSDSRTLNSSLRSIASVAVRLKMTGEFNGDLYAYVRHSSGFAVLLNRPGKTASSPAGYDDSGFDITLRTGAANGDIHLYRDVSTPASGLPLIGTWVPDGRTEDPATVTDASSRSGLLTSFNGLNAAGEWTLYLADLESGGTNMLREWGLEITGTTAPALVWPNPSDITYGTALGPAQLNAQATSNSTNVNGTFSYSPASGALLNAGPGQILSVTFTPADTSSFLPASTNVTINVLPAVVIVTAQDKSKVYGAALPELTATYSGFVLGEGTNNLTHLATLDTVATATSDVGTYPISANGASSPNYSFQYVNGTLTITQALTSASLISSANPSLPGANLTFTMNVATVAPGDGTPTGSVNFRIDGGIAGSGLLANGVATFTVGTLAVGLHTVVAEYGGEHNFIGHTNMLAPDQVINTPPVAGNDTIERYPTQGTKVRLSTLLANDSDADGDSLTLTVSSTSASGATITVSDGWAYYTPMAGFTNVDSFTYVITDGRGGSATGTVSVVIKVDIDPGQNLAITDLGNGSFRIRGNGIPGRVYRLQFTDGLNPVNWQDLPNGSVNADSMGAFEYVDTAGSTARYYRTVYP